MVARVRLLGRVTAAKVNRDLWRNDSESVGSLISSGGTLARWRHMTAYAIRVLRGTGYRGMASYGVRAYVTVATLAEVVRIHGCSELGPRLVDTVARAASYSRLGVSTVLPLRILLSVLLDIAAWPPGLLVSEGHNGEVLRAEVVTHAEVNRELPLLVRAVSPCVALAANIGGCSES